MTDDAAEIWWDPSARDPSDGSSGGAFCYVNGGARHRFDWPDGPDPFFSGPCDTGA